MGKLAGKTAWVTGGGRGIGRSIALAMAAEGANVAVSSRTVAELQGVVSEIEALGSKGLAVKADAMSLKDTLDSVQQIKSEFGSLDILINNAGGMVPTRREDGLQDEEIDEFNFIDNIDLNLFSA